MLTTQANVSSAFLLKKRFTGSPKSWKKMTRPPLRIVGAEPDGCPWEGCSGYMEYWEEQIFDHVFPAMGCSECPGFWVWGEDAGEWLCSMSHSEWQKRGRRVSG